MASSIPDLHDLQLSAPAYHTSMLASLDCRGHTHLILGSNPLAAARASSSLAAGAKPILIAPPSADFHYGIQKHLDAGVLTHVPRAFAESDLLTLGRAEVDGVVDAVFVTSARDPQAARVSELCRRQRIPVNVVDAPALCSFSLLSVHVDGPLQIGVTTNGSGCKLASRIRREVAATLPAGLGGACARLGQLRRRIQHEDRERARSLTAAAAAAREHREHEGEKPRAAEGRYDGDGERHDDEGTDDSVDQTATFNQLVIDTDADAAKTRRARWLAQVCEYWPLRRLAAVTDTDVESILHSYSGGPGGASDPSAGTVLANPNPAAPSGGRIILAGSGPGHPDLLTRATYRAIQGADLILADKLVPAGVLDLIPRRTQVVIARKFPGNADQAQDELLEQALGAVREGKTVLRLKQGDPFVYGRGGEEVAFFRRHGLAEADGGIAVLPGVTSALSAPLFAGVPVTQRDVADQILVCTGTGKKGRAPDPPGYRAGRTVVFLMALHRIAGLVAELTTYAPELAQQAKKKEEAVAVAAAATSDETGEAIQAEGNFPAVQDGSGSAAEPIEFRRRLWPADTPCAVVERASCPDQRVIRTTLRFVTEAIEQEGSRPPGLLLVGGACEALYTPEKGRSWVVEDGFKGLDLDDIVPIGMAALA